MNDFCLSSCLRSYSDLLLCLTVAWKWKLINLSFLPYFCWRSFDHRNRKEIRNYLFCKWQRSSPFPKFASSLQQTPHSLSPFIQLGAPWNCFPNHLSSACLHSRDSFLQGESSFGKVLACPFSWHSLLMSTFLLHNDLTSAGLRSMSPA